jgi:tRNA A37 N6-isopentenylltransferase MiaA
MPTQRELSEVDLARIAREIARDIRPLEVVLQGAQVSSEQFERIKENPIFQVHLVEEAQLWSASTRQTLRERVSVKAAAMIEELLVETVDLIRDKQVPGAARVAGLQFLAKLGQLGETALVRDDGSGRVQINIVIGDRKLSFDKETSSDSSRAIDVTPEVVE